jgi:hypothetical protein
MDNAQILADLFAERERISQAIAALEALTPTGTPDHNPPQSYNKAAPVSNLPGEPSSRNTSQHNGSPHRESSLQKEDG